MTPSLHSRSHGFTLVELSIVLVILGLLVGGVMVGQNLLRGSEIANIVKDKNKYVSAIVTFRDKYNGLPGDISNASQIWGAAAAPPAACIALTTNIGGKLTCDGNSNGRIAAVNNSEDYERHRAWQHLMNAGLVGGNFSGVAGAAGPLNSVPGENCPQGALAGTCWVIAHMGAVSNSANWFDGIYDHVLFIGRESTTGPHTAFLSPEDAWAFDKKYDDGSPATGTLVARVSDTNCQSATVSTDLTATYKASSKQVACSFAFRNVLN